MKTNELELFVDYLKTAYEDEEVLTDWVLGSLTSTGISCILLAVFTPQALTIGNILGIAVGGLITEIGNDYCQYRFN